MVRFVGYYKYDLPRIMRRRRERSMNPHAKDKNFKLCHGSHAALLSASLDVDASQCMHKKMY